MRTFLSIAILLIGLTIQMTISFRESSTKQTLYQPEEDHEDTHAEREEGTEEGQPAEQLLTYKGFLGLLSDSQEILTPMLDNLFVDDKVLECLAPHICNLIGSEYYYDPYVGKCKKQSLFARALNKRKKMFPELMESCQEPDILFKEYIAQGGRKPETSK